MVLAVAAGPTLLAQVAAPPRNAGDDDWFDISDFLKEKYGFLPVVMPITEPAVGYGAAGGLAFLSRPLGDAKGGHGRPDITMLGGAATENGSRALAAGDLRYWLDDRLQTRVFLVDGAANLDFHGLGEDPTLDRRPLRYNLDPLGVSLEARYRLADSPWWIGLGYGVARVDVSFDAPAGSPGLPSFDRSSTIAALTPSVTYDSRDNMFTPTTGSYFEATLGLFGPALGGDEEFQRAYLLGMHFTPLAERLFLGLRGDAAATFGGAPFYLQPFVPLRGVPLLRYQGEAIASVEAELRWQFWGRISAVGFAGVGAAWSDLDRLSGGAQATAGGIGLRYEIAREYGIHVGLDVAFGPEDTVLYVQVGSAWVRP
ncbi:MAG: BamA/TamA family outer membrane protein [Planctomycetes bacterium]|nr:BamA/TamA family outer membrane protein [Planctomycetota bacterium]